MQVKKHLKISIAGVQEGDFTFVMGFPGRNWRYMISDEVEERMQTTNFMRQHVRGARQKVLMEQMLKDPAVRIHYASKYASSANYWKNAIGMNEGLVRLKVLDTKRKQQEELLARGREKVMILIRRHLMKYVLSLLIDGMHSITSKPLTKHLSQHLTLCASLLQQKWSLPLSQKTKNK